MKPSVYLIKNFWGITFEGDLMMNVPKHENRVVFDKKYPVFAFILYYFV